MKDKLNILFKVTAGKTFGTGNVMRSMTLADTIGKDLKGEIFFHCNLRDRILDWVKDKYRIIEANGDDELIKRIIDKQIDAVIIDQTEEYLNLCKSLKSKKPNLVIIGMDYFNYDNLYLDVIINLFNQNTSVLNPVEKFRGKYFEGPEYAIIKDSFTGHIMHKKPIRQKARAVLVTFGGADPKNNSEKILRLLEKIGGQLDVTIIIGSLFPNPEILENIADRNSWRVHKAVDDMEDFISNADLGFSGGGTTLLEFCALGVPVIIVPQNNNEARFATYLQGKEVVEVLPEDTLGAVQLIESMLTNYEKRSRISSNQRKLVDGKGKDRIRRIIFNIVLGDET